MFTYKRRYWNKGGEPVTDTILFGKYQLIRILGKGRSGTVYLARHLELEEYRAIKQVPKCCSDYQQFKREALLMKRLRHPGIPIVYDLHEDEVFSYLIEEFLEGDSFYDIIRKKGHMNQAAVIRYGIQLCGLISYLHSAEDIPILYLDLQPRNLILCHEQVKLLDFEQAGTGEEANQRTERYGTPGFCAPEQRCGEAVGVYTDVYQIGAVLAYLLTGQEEEEAIGQIAGALGRIIRRCLRSDGKERYQSAAQLGRELELVRSETGVSDDQSTALILAFAGTRPGIGVTHLALGACAYLNACGNPCLYEEHNFSGDVRSMLRWIGKETDSFGICQNFGVAMKPWYGQAVQLPKDGYGIVIRDYGTSWKDAAAAGKESGDGGLCVIPILVTGGKWWHQELGMSLKRRLAMELKSVSARQKLLVIVNQAIQGITEPRWMTELETDTAAVLDAPRFLNPFRLTEEAIQFYGQLCKQIQNLSGSCLDKKSMEGRRTSRLWDSFVRSWEEKFIQKRKRRLSE